MKTKNNPFITVIICILLVIEFASLFLMYKSGQNKPVSLNNVLIDTEKETTPVYAIMLEQNIGSSDYLESKDNTWPENGYKFNEIMSKCLDPNGNLIPNAVSYDKVNNLAVVDANDESMCYLYFDKI